MQYEVSMTVYMDMIANLKKSIKMATTWKL